MTEVRVPKDLWDTTKRPEAVIVNWFYRDRATVGAGVRRRSSKSSRRQPACCASSPHRRRW